MIKWLYFFWMVFLEAFVQLVGLVVNAITIPFARFDDDESNRGAPVQYSQYPQYGTWRRLRLPRWALWWDNPYDGLLGDKRGWWANECRKHGRTEHSFMSKYIWSAVRNPANYASRIIFGCDVSDCRVVKLAGNTDVVKDDGSAGTSWHYIVATDPKGREYVRLYGAFNLVGNKYLLVNIGWKIKMEHNTVSSGDVDQERYKGNTFRAKIFTKKS
jgi:hypothetical protein